MNKYTKDARDNIAFTWFRLGLEELETLENGKVFSSQGILPKILENQERIALEN